MSSTPGPGYSARLKYDVSTSDAANEYVQKLREALPSDRITILQEGPAVVVEVASDSTTGLREELLPIFDAVAAAGIH